MQIFNDMWKRWTEWKVRYGCCSMPQIACVSFQHDTCVQLYSSWSRQEKPWPGNRENAWLRVTQKGIRGIVSVVLRKQLLSCSICSFCLCISNNLIFSPAERCAVAIPFQVGENLMLYGVDNCVMSVFSHGFFCCFLGSTSGFWLLTMEVVIPAVNIAPYWKCSETILWSIPFICIFVWLTRLRRYMSASPSAVNLSVKYSS